MKFFLRQNNLKTVLLFLILFSTIFIVFNIYFPHEAFAMAPPQYIVEDFYGNKEYVGPDPYGHFHKPSKDISPLNTNTYYTRYDNSNNSDYFVSDKTARFKAIYELDGKPIHQPVNITYDRDELHF
jgi:hypothetical protein